MKINLFKQGRKFFYACALTLICSGLLLGRFLTGAEFVDLAKWTTGLLMAGNVGSKFAAAMKGEKVE